MTHDLKIIPKYFEAVKSGAKTFEVQKNDRPFRVGDLLLLREYTDEEYTGKSITVEITYILRGEYCREGYCVLGVVRHGRWIENHTDLICSVCKWKYSDELPFMSNNGLDSMTEAFAHCPHCGAKMDGGVENDQI